MVIDRRGPFFSLLGIALEQLNKDEAKKLWHDVIEDLGLNDKLRSLHLNPETIPIGDIDLLINWVQEASIPLILTSDIWSRVITASGGSITSYTGNEDEKIDKKSSSIVDSIKAIFINAPKVLFRKVYKVFIILCSIEAVLYSVLILTDSETIVHIIIKIVFHVIGMYTFFLLIFLSVGLFPFLILFELSRYIMKPNLFSKFLSAIRIFLIVLLIISPVTYYLTGLIYSASLVIKLYVLTASIGICIFR